MNHEPVFSTKYALARELKAFARRLGICEDFADAAAQIHVQQSKAVEHWSAFIKRNCASCEFTPTQCRFLNPTSEQCSPGANPLEMKAANAHVVEMGKLVDCPVFQSREEKS